MHRPVLKVQVAPKDGASLDFDVPGLLHYQIHFSKFRGKRAYGLELRSPTCGGQLTRGDSTDLAAYYRCVTCGGESNYVRDTVRYFNAGSVGAFERTIALATDPLSAVLAATAVEDHNESIIAVAHTGLRSQPMEPHLAENFGKLKVFEL